MVTLLLAGSGMVLIGTSIVGAQDAVLPREQLYRLAIPWEGPTTSLNPYAPGGQTPWIITDPEYPIVYEHLGYWDTLTGDLKGILAEDWTWVDDYTLEIKIRPEAHFRKGQPVTAEDVAFSYESMSDPMYGGGPVTAIESVEAVDEKTVRVHLKSEYPGNRQVYSLLTNYLIVYKGRWSQLLEEYGEDIIDFTNLDNPEEVNASGPYTLMYSGPETTTYERVEGYWGEQIGWYFLPEYVEGYWYGTNTQTLLVGMQGRETDYVQAGVAPTKYKELEYIQLWNRDAPKISEMAFHEAGMYVLIPNLDDPVLRQTWLRKALALAIDYKYVIEYATGGGACRASPTYLHSEMPDMEEFVNNEVTKETYGDDGVEIGYLGHLYVKYNTEKAIEILQEHCSGSVEEGWTITDPVDNPDLMGVELGGWTMQAVNGWSDCMGVVEIAAKNWSDIGIPTDPEYPEYMIWDSNWMTGSFDWMQVWTWNYVVGTPIAQTFDVNFVVPHTNVWWGGNGSYIYEKYFTENYPDLPNTVGVVEELTMSLYGMEPGTDEYMETAKELQSIVVPQVPSIPVLSKFNPAGQLTDRWVNFPTKEDPGEEHRLDSANAPGIAIKHAFPRSVETTGFSLSPGVVEVGEPATAKVTLKNTADCDLRYAVYVRKGPAKSGPGPEVIAHTVTTVPANGTKTVELEVTLDEHGSYTLTVDDWRIDKWDPGDPIEKTLMVTKAGELTLEELVEMIDIAISAAADAGETADAVMEIAESALELAEENAERPTGVSTEMVIAAMVVTIIIALVGAAVISRK